MTVHLSILIFWPLLLAALGALAPRAVAPLFALVGALVPLGYAVILVADHDPSARGLQYLTDDAWIDELGIRYTLGVDGLNLWLVALTALLFAASAVWVVLRPPVRPKLFALHFGIDTSVLDGTIGQNAVAQARAFAQAMALTGVIITKLDGTARGGIVIAVHEAIDVPIKFVGVGEGLDDLLEFDAADYARDLLEE
jgi:hypothetical protein